MRNESPELVQAEDWARPNACSGATTPIFLLHDGGGTTFAYHCLDPLYRFVYGIANPHFYTGARFHGGLPEMGRLYAKRIRSAVSQADFPARKNSDGSVNIFIGGWSLGGLLSLEVAKVLADDPLVRITGILMIDSICPRRPADFSGALAVPDTSEEGKTKNQVLSQRCMTEARRMVAEWDVPVWPCRLASKRPKMVLLRATDYIPVESPGISSLDVCRQDPALGWGQYDETMFEHVLDAQGHHFNLFAFERVSATTEVVRRGLDRLEEATHPRGLR
ncbi:hypothetical protein HIM_03534 [Hirsutella minnesotensis 3608]|uniref:Thioesterase domain-containing protein n=1 Tax=Hirsutella minnesotensis 3608 TaxID=1043627 RepID=A0A0F7ZVU3_9HYPO|nr:hypothetical protein HIM_03534 [Hirsutella minnesotensis 3608]